MSNMGDSERNRVEESSTILLVDDDPVILAVLQRALTALRVQVTLANTGAEALARLDKSSFDLVVSDIQMPGMNGLKLLRAVREYDLDLPVVLMTGAPDIRGAAAAVEYGAFQYLIKPVEIDRLRAVVDKGINAGRIARLKRECADEFGSGSFYVGDRAGIESKLNKALASLSLAYQPIVRGVDGSVFGYEALLRCDEPTLPHPGAVLKAAARVRRVHDVGRAVRELAAAKAQQVTLRGHFLFVNVHTEDLMDPALYLPAAPLTRLAKHVVLELTDRASLEHVTDVSGRIARLRALGYRIALDDLGAGQAGLETFSQLEPEFVKVDSSVIRGIHKDANKAGIVRSFVRVCHNLGKSVIAEGVETREERDSLLEAECDLMQGYFFGRPGPIVDEGELQRGVA
jgi:EAL domain-containing protein (putative c-di-GMP-specific phosphodiesterase class I)/CheY-like chemotaxis protein